MACLGAMLMGGGVAIASVAHLVGGPEFFFDDLRQSIFREITKADQEGHSIDLVLMTHRLAGVDPSVDWAAVLMACVETVPSTARAAEYAAIVAELHQRRHLVVEALKLAERASRERGTHARGILLDSRQSLDAICDLASEQPAYTTFWDEARELENSIRQGTDQHELLPTGIPEIDIPKGGMPLGELIILGARPSKGKTSLALSIAYAVAEHHGVLLFSREMNKRSINYRLISMASKIQASTLINGDLSRDAMLEAVASFTRKPQSRRLLRNFDTKNAEEMCAIARGAIRSKGVRLVVIDYLQLVKLGHKSGGHDQKRYQDLGEITGMLKDLAQHHNVVVLALSQVSRDVEKRRPPRPAASDLRESGNIEQDADQIWLLWRKEEDDVLIMDVAKNRNGAVQRDIRIPFDWRTMCPISLGQESLI